MVDLQDARDANSTAETHDPLPPRGARSRTRRRAGNRRGCTRRAGTGRRTRGCPRARSVLRPGTSLYEVGARSSSPRGTTTSRRSATRPAISADARADLRQSAGIAEKRDSEPAGRLCDHGFKSCGSWLPQPIAAEPGGRCGVSRGYQELRDAHDGPRFSRNARSPSWPSSLVAPLGDPARRLGAVGPLAHEPLRPPRRLRARREQLADDPLDRRVEIVGDLVHEPDAQRGLRVEALAGDEVAPRRARADLRERERRDDRRDDPELHLRERERASGAATAMSAHATSPAPPPSAWPCTRATTGAGQPSIASSICRSALRVGDVLLVARARPSAHPLDVGAGGEARALAGEHDRAHVVADVANASASSAISAASKALRRSGRASVTRRTSPSRSTRSAIAIGVARTRLEFDAMLRGALAAALTPLRDGGAAPTRTRSGRTSTSSPRPGSTGARARHDGRGDPALASRSARGRPSSSSTGRARRSPCTAARRRRRTRSRSPRTRRRRAPTRRRGDRAAVLPARRGRAARALRRGRARVRAAAVLRLRVRSARAATRCRSPVIERLRERGAEPRGPEGLRHAVGAVRAVPARRARRLRRRRGAVRQGLRARRGRRGLRRSRRVFPERVVALVREPTPATLGAAARRARALPVPRRGEDRRSAGAACRCGPTCARRCAA